MRLQGARFCALAAVLIFGSITPVFGQRLGVLSQQGNTEITIAPNPLDFGRIRLQTSRLDSFRIHTLVPSVSILVDSQLGARPLGFHLTNPADPNLVNGTNIQEHVLFQPLTEGPAVWSDTVRTKLGSTEIEIIKGRGVYPHISDTNLYFGKLHVDSTSLVSTVTIRNVGSDTTFIYTITKSGPNASDFALTFDTTPSRTNAVFLDTLGAMDAAWSYTAQFTPTSIGPETCYVQIQTGIGFTIDTLTGIGAEPHIQVLPAVLNFGTIDVPMLPGTAGDLLDSLRIAILNVGNLPGLLDSLTHSDTSHFHYAFKIPHELRSYIESDTLIDADSIVGWVYFSVDSVGDFYDTLSIVNDSRYKPVLYLQAHVRVGPPVLAPLANDLDTVRDCDSVQRIVMITNPYELRVTFDSISFKGNSGGFKPELLRFPINIPAGGSFPLTVSYQFPADSLNGSQHMVLYLYERSGDSPEHVDTVTFSVVRLAQLIGTYAVPPTYTPSSSDELPFRLPIYITGAWLNRPELDSFTISIRLDNDLIQPVGVDRTGSITEKLSGETDSVSLNWDQATRTYMVTLYGEHLSQLQDTTNTLLLTILARVLVSPDTVGSVSTQISTLEPTCAARYLTGVDTVVYANDCGDQEIRSIFTHVPIVFGIEPIYPDPVDPNVGGVSLGFNAASTAQITWSLWDSRGEVFSAGNNFLARNGYNTLQIASEKLPSNGTVFLRMQVRNPSNDEIQEVSTKFVIAR